ncbi:hypothetical protein UPYG_G00232290 [Umbra pygmaea]|uniref:Uncharacterized protein n=1 Tax=Umbra pygmaea TaxID=75934 RepID=A0ABD0X1J1_UMBPY
MGATESASQQEDIKCEDEDAVVDESVNDVQNGGSPDAQLVQNNGEISGLSEKVDPTDELSGLGEDLVVAGVDEENSAIISQKEDIPEVKDALAEGLLPLENVDNDGKTSPNAVNELPNDTERDVELNEIMLRRTLSRVHLRT